MTEKKSPLVRRIKKSDEPIKAEKKVEFTTIGAKLDKALWRRLRAHAIRTGTTGGELLNKAIEEYLDRHESNGV